MSMLVRVLVLLLALLASPQAWPQSDERILDYAIAVEVRADGSLDVAPRRRRPARAGELSRSVPMATTPGAVSPASFEASPSTVSAGSSADRSESAAG